MNFWWVDTILENPSQIKNDKRSAWLAYSSYQIKQ